MKEGQNMWESFFIKKSIFNSMLKILKNLIKMNKFFRKHTCQIDSRRSRNLKRLIITKEMERLLNNYSAKGVFSVEL